MSPTTWEAHQNPRAQPGDFGELPRSLMTPQIQKSMYQFYSIMKKQNCWWINKCCQCKCSKLSPNCLSYSMVACAQLATVHWGQVIWLFLLDSTCSNYCDVTARFVLLNFSHTLHKDRQHNIQYSYTLSREYRVARYRYSRLLFTSEDRLCANLRVQWQ